MLNTQKAENDQAEIILYHHIRSIIKILFYTLFPFLLIITKLSYIFFWTFENKQTNAICIGGSVSTSHDAFFTHLEAI